MSSANLIWPEANHSSHHHGGGPPGLSAVAPKTWDVVLGISLTLASTLILAMRLVAEEFALQGTSMHPLQVSFLALWLSSHTFLPQDGTH